MSYDYDRQSAEIWLSKAEHPETLGNGETIESCLVTAQVYATLALGAQLQEISAEIARLPS